jgi:hypothetical protein
VSDQRASLILAALALVACGNDGPGTSNVQPDAIAISDAMPQPLVTDLRGSLDGRMFTLRYGHVKRGSDIEPIWICVADVPVSYAECESTSGPDRTFFIGPFVYNTEGTARWGIPQVWLYRTGANNNPSSAWAQRGTLQVVRDAAPAGALELSLDVDFGESVHTTGDVYAPP